DDWERNDQAVDALLSGESSWQEGGFVEPSELRRLAGVLTLFTGASEAALAAAFLWPLGRRLSRWRHGLLLRFAAAHFRLATVRLFGWLLMALGVAQCEPEARRTRHAYLAVFSLVGLFRSLPLVQRPVSG